MNTGQKESVVSQVELFLIRHAQSQNNAAPEADRVPDPEITELGWQQARRLADDAPAWQLDRIYCSPFRRTLQTAQPLSDSLKLKPEVRVDLHEVGGCYSGYFGIGRQGEPGMNRNEIESEFGYAVEARIDESGWWKRQPYEEHHVAAGRGQRLLADTQAEFGATDLKIAYVMHADIKMILVREVAGPGMEVPLNTSVTRLQFDGDRIDLLEYNNVSHLNEPLFSF